MDGKTVSNEEKYFEIFERLKNVGFRKEIQAGCQIVSLEILVARVWQVSRQVSWQVSSWLSLTVKP